jgi:hypothetical protein
LLNINITSEVPEILESFVVFAQCDNDRGTQGACGACLGERRDADLTVELALLRLEDDHFVADRRTQAQRPDELFERLTQRYVLARAGDGCLGIDLALQPSARVEHDVFRALLLEESRDLSERCLVEVEAVLPS